MPHIRRAGPCDAKAVKLGGLSLEAWRRQTAGEMVAITHDSPVLTLRHYGRADGTDPLEELKRACADILRQQHAEQAAREQAARDALMWEREARRGRMRRLIWAAVIACAGGLAWYFREPNRRFSGLGYCGHRVDDRRDGARRPARKRQPMQAWLKKPV